MHHEQAEICHTGAISLSGTAEPLLLQPYTILIGQGYSEQNIPNGKPVASEFLSIGNTLIHNEESDSTASFKIVYDIGTNGTPSDLLHFTCHDGKSVSLSELIRYVMEIVVAECAGMVIIADTAGITACRGPVEANTPVRFVSYPTFAHRTALLTGIVHRQASTELSPYTRRLADANPYCDHFHAAIYPLFTVREEKPPLNQTISELTVDNLPLGVFHLLNDDRETEGSGESRFCEGFIWMMKVK